MVINNIEKIKNIPPLPVSPWLAFPFIILLSMIVMGPLFFPHFWHTHYPKIAIMLATIVIGYYCFILKEGSKPVEAAADYIQFMALITALYITTGGILIKVDLPSLPLTNILFLFIGALCANIIGTQGASMLFIRPYLRLNQHRIKAYHIVFFIFIVSNIGGALTPIGDPPLFLGFLKGVPFEWTLVHNFIPWIVAIFILLSIFYFLDKKNSLSLPVTSSPPLRKESISIKGRKNIVWLAIVIAAVFLDPTIVVGLPTISYHGHSISFVRELIMISAAIGSYYTANKKILKSNKFNFEPLTEVCFLFIGIFGTMIPALELINTFARSEYGKHLITPTTLYWGTGICSSILDNAPTYLNFAAASMASKQINISLIADVQAYAAGCPFPSSITELKAVSIASVFFGAMTYIGNCPNFMVKSMAEQAGIKMPSFGHYIWRFSLPFLLPVLLIIWALFFAKSP